MTFGEKLKKVRLQLLFTQRQFAKEIGVTFVTICRIENGQAQATLETQRKLRDYCISKNIEY